MTNSQDGRSTQTRRRLIDAAIGLVDQSGWESVTLKAVAHECGVSAPASYKHFPNKAALLKATDMEMSTRLARACAPLVDADPRNSLIGMGKFILTFAGRHPRLLEFVMFGPGNTADLPRTREAGRSGAIGEAGGAPACQPASAPREAGAYPFLELVRQEVARLTALQGRPPEAENRFFIAMWSFVQGYSALVAAGATSFDDGFFRAAFTALLTIDERT